MYAASGSELSKDFGPWNPGVTSVLSSELLALCTIFREENAFTTLTEVKELAGLTGLELSDLVVFRPERLALHELLLRVTADIEVYDPKDAKVDNLGIEFRRIVETIHTQYIAPRVGEAVRLYESLRKEITTIIEKELTVLFDRRAPLARSPGLRGWLRNKIQTPFSDHHQWEHHEQVVSRWNSEAQRTNESLLKAAYGSLSRSLQQFEMKHGRLWGDQSLLASIATGLACNEYAGEMIGQLIDPYVKAAIKQEGLRLLPNQERPIILSTKGASASGKSKRPRQRKLATRIGAQWSDFALISPDIFRRSLLRF